jgi:hypothetical protein
MGALVTDDGRLDGRLRDYAAARFSGLLRVDGRPGGAIHLVEGGISACQTSGAPSLEVILLRSGRVAEADWNAAFAQSAIAGRPMTAELVERGLLGAGEVEALLRIALADAVFALTSGRVDSVTEAPAADCLLPLDPAARAGWLLAEAARRRQVLSVFPAPLVGAADRIAVAPASVPPADAVGDRQGEILALVDGRRTPRDLAFALGRGLYETMLDLARLQAGNVVVISARGPDHPAPRPVEDAPGGEHDETASGLPRRGRDRDRDRDRAGSGRAGDVGRRGFAANLRMLLPRSEGESSVETP